MLKETMEELIDKLSLCSKQQLVAFISQLYGYQEEMDNRIDTLVSQHNSNDLYETLKKRIQILNQETRFIHYNDSSDFSCSLDQILSDIEKLLLPMDSKSAFDLLDMFVLTASSTFERADDSSGAIGDSYRYSITLWLAAAAKYRSTNAQNSINWQEKILSLYQQNDYGVYDELIDDSAILLTETELRELALQFENEAKKRLETEKNNQSYDFTLATACIGLSSAATALKDIDLFERATLIRSPNPNCLEKERLAKFSLSLNNPQNALKWLIPRWEEQRFESNYLNLLEQCYLQLNDTEKLRQTRKRYYELYPSFSSLKKLVEVTPEPAQAILITKAVSDAKKIPCPISATNMLLDLNEIDAAAQIIITRSKEVNGNLYTSVTELAEVFEKHHQPLASVICYRALLDSILSRGYTKAYRYGAKYLKKMKNLDLKIKSYKTHINLTEYINNIKLSHGRKRSFWALAE